MRREPGDNDFDDCAGMLTARGGWCAGLLTARDGWCADSTTAATTYGQINMRCCLSCLQQAVHRYRSCSLHILRIALFLAFAPMLANGCEAADICAMASDYDAPAIAGASCCNDAQCTSFNYNALDSSCSGCTGTQYTTEGACTGAGKYWVVATCAQAAPGWAGNCSYLQSNAVGLGNDCCPPAPAEGTTEGNVWHFLAWLTLLFAWLGLALGGWMSKRWLAERAHRLRVHEAATPTLERALTRARVVAAQGKGTAAGVSGESDTASRLSVLA